MKKSVILTLAALAALMAASCQKEETGRILTATFEQYDHNSKAYINDLYYACWENGDAVSINGTRSTIDIENTTATIAAPTSDNLMAFYPADGVTDLTSTGGTVKLPHIQTYAENTDGKQVIDNPMAAYCPEGSNELRFRNLCALLKVTIQVNAPTSVKGIQVKGIDNQMLWGEAQLMLNNQNQPVLTSFTNGSNSVMLNFTTAVTISGSKSFYIVVPAASNFENLTIAVLTVDGNTYANNSKTSLIGQALLRNQIGAISYTLNGDEDATFTPDWMIRYTATSEITTSISGTIFGSICKSRDFNDGNGNGYLLFDGPVTTIPQGNPAGSNYFKSCTSITLPASLTSIKNYAFIKCSSLTSISLPQGVTSIGNYAFQDCTSLTTISLPASLTSIGTLAFNNCSSLTSISLPQGVTSIGNNTFQNCSSLTSISLPANLTLMGTYVFSGCSSLTSISLPQGVTSIGNYAFRDCTSLTSINLPASLNSIGSKAFYNCSNLTSISLPANLTSMGTYVFYGCSSLTSISLPQGVTSIGNNAFYYCSSLVRVDCHCTTAPTIQLNTFSTIPTASAVLHVPSGHGSDYSSWNGYFQGGIVEDL